MDDIQIPSETVFIRLFEEQALKLPGEVILEYQGQTWTYAQINQKANQLAAYLVSQVQAEKCYSNNAPRVGLFLRQSPEAIITILATMKAGIAHVPLGFQRSAEELVHIINDTGLTLIVTNVDDRKLAIHALRQTSTYENVTTVDFKSALDSPVDQVVSSERVRADTLAYVIYSSGSTSKPKGIAIPHGQLLDNAGALSAVLSDADKVTKDSHIGGYTVLGFDASLFDMLMAFKVGACLHIIPHKVRLNPEQLKNFLRDQSISHIVLLPPVMAALADLGAAALEEALNKLKVICATGEAFSPNLVDRWQDLLPEIKLINGYGPTEAVISAMISEPLLGLREPGGEVPIGKVRSGLDVALLAQKFADDDNDVPVDLQERINAADLAEVGVVEGCEGEIYLVGRHMGRYWGDTSEANKLNRQRLAQLSDGRTLYRTFDGAMRRADGNYCYTTRLDNQLKVRGVLITLESIDDELQKACRERVALEAFGLSADAPYISQCYAAVQKKHQDSNDCKLYFNLVVPDAEKRKALLENNKIQFQYLVNEIDDALVEGRIDPSKRPHAYRLLSGLEKTVHGKLDRKYEPERAGLNECPPQGLDQTKPDFTNPRDAIPCQLVRLWAASLQLKPAEISLGDDYFVLGGNSILILPMLNKVKAQFPSFDVSLETFRQDPTINGISRQISQNELSLDEVLIEKEAGRVAGDESAPTQPIILVHALFGSAEDDYRDLIKHVKRNNRHSPIAVINSPGLTDPKAMPTTLKALARYYVELVNQKYPEQACWLIGWSSGGSIAHTMASLMREEQVAGVIMIDTQCLSYTNQLSHEDYFKRMVDAVNYDHFRGKVGYKGEKINNIAEKHNVFKKQSLKRQTAGFMTYLESQWHFPSPLDENGAVIVQTPEALDKIRRFAKNTQCMLNLLMHYEPPKTKVKKVGLLVAESSHEKLRDKLPERQRCYLGWVRGDEVLIDRKTILKSAQHVVVLENPGKVAEAIEATMQRLQPTRAYHVQPINPCFTGRTEALKQLAENLKEDKFAVITGLGGMGKTHMANKFMQAIRDRGEVADYEFSFDLLLSLNASDLFSGLFDVASAEWGDCIASQLSTGRTPNAFVRRVMNKLIEKYSKILVYLDAVEKEVDVYDFVEEVRGQGCSVFATSRNNEWQDALRVKLENFTMEEAKDYITEKLNNDETDDSKASLANELHRLPLALAQAVAYIKAKGGRGSIESYLSLYRQYPAQRLREGGRRYPLDGYTEAVYSTWVVSIRAIEAENENREDGDLELFCAKILNLCAFLSPDNIPLDLLREGIDENNFNGSLDELIKYSLIDFSYNSAGDQSYIRVHPLVQKVIRLHLQIDKNLSEEDRASFISLQHVEREVRVVNEDPGLRDRANLTQEMDAARLNHIHPVLLQISEDVQESETWREAEMALIETESRETSFAKLYLLKVLKRLSRNLELHIGSIERLSLLMGHLSYALAISLQYKLLSGFVLKCWEEVFSTYSEELKDWLSYYESIKKLRRCLNQESINDPGQDSIFLLSDFAKCLYARILYVFIQNEIRLPSGQISIETFSSELLALNINPNNMSQSEQIDWVLFMMSAKMESVFHQNDEMSLREIIAQKIPGLVKLYDRVAFWNPYLPRIILRAMILSEHFDYYGLFIPLKNCLIDYVEKRSDFFYDVPPELPLSSITQKKIKLTIDYLCESSASLIEGQSFSADLLPFYKKFLGVQSLHLQENTVKYFFNRREVCRVSHNPDARNDLSVNDLECLLDKEKRCFGENRHELFYETCILLGQYLLLLDDPDDQNRGLTYLNDVLAWGRVNENIPRIHLVGVALYVGQFLLEKDGANARILEYFQQAEGMLEQLYKENYMLTFEGAWLIELLPEAYWKLGGHEEIIRNFLEPKIQVLRRWAFFKALLGKGLAHLGSIYINNGVIESGIEMLNEALAWLRGIPHSRCAATRFRDRRNFLISLSCRAGESALLAGNVELARNYVELAQDQMSRGGAPEADHLFQTDVTNALIQKIAEISGEPERWIFMGRRILGKLDEAYSNRCFDMHAQRLDDLRMKHLQTTAQELVEMIPVYLEIDATLNTGVARYELLYLYSRALLDLGEVGKSCEQLLMAKKSVVDKDSSLRFFVFEDCFDDPRYFRRMIRGEITREIQATDKIDLLLDSLQEPLVQYVDICCQEGQLNDALEYCKLLKGKIPEQLDFFQNRLAVIYDLMGHDEQAEILFLSLCEAQRAKPEAERLSRCFVAYALFLFSRTRHLDAVNFFDEAKAIIQANPSSDNLVYNFLPNETWYKQRTFLTGVKNANFQVDAQILIAYFSVKSLEPLNRMEDVHAIKEAFEAYAPNSITFSRALLKDLLGHDVPVPEQSTRDVAVTKIQRWASGIALFSAKTKEAKCELQSAVGQFQTVFTDRMRAAPSANVREQLVRDKARFFSVAAHINDPHHTRVLFGLHDAMQIFRGNELKSVDGRPGLKY
jgi:non-ribosomal peptide synthetase component F